MFTGVSTPVLAMVSLSGGDCSAGSVLTFVAHADDDLYFINPAIQDAIAAQQCVQTVVTTAGYFAEPDNSARELGLQAAYAQMAGVSNDWSSEWRMIAGKPLRHYQLRARPQIALWFMQLPCSLHDQLTAGTYVSLQQMFADDTHSQMTYGQAGTAYSRSDWLNVYVALLQLALPTAVYSLAPDSEFPANHGHSQGEGSHPDHVFVAKMTQEALALYLHNRTLKPVVEWFMDYPIYSRPINLNANDGRKKHAAMAAYCTVDARACNPSVLPNTECKNTDELPWGEAWLCRTYTVPEFLQAPGKP